jgi:ElaA protein
VGGFEGLGTRELHDILRLRVDVFVVEQNCPYPELDGLDLEAIHVVGKLADNTVVAYCRILPPQKDGLPHIGRVVVPTEYRGQGLGKELMNEALQVLRLNFGSERSAIAAQAHLQKFYADFGYVVTGPEYLLDGIPHVDMELRIVQP